MFGWRLLLAQAADGSVPKEAIGGETMGHALPLGFENEIRRVQRAQEPVTGLSEKGKLSRGDALPFKSMVHVKGLRDTDTRAGARETGYKRRCGRLVMKAPS